MRKTSSGFTIVELLIVIVVIAILAAISVVAYTGIQARAAISAGKSFDASLRRGLSLDSAAAFSFSEGTGTSSADSSGQSNNATINGSWAAGMDGGNALQTNNDGTGASFGSGIYFGDKSFTVAAWVKSSDTDGAQSRILGKSFGSPGPGGYFYLNFGNGNPHIEARDSSGTYWSTGWSSINISGKWAHVAAVIDREKGTSFLYVNGKLEKQSAVISSSGYFGDASATSPFTVGYQGSTAALSLDGLIDDIYIYKSSLNLAQIEKLYKAEIAWHGESKI